MLKNIEGTTIKIKFKDEILELPKDIKEQISIFWKQSKKDNPSLFNGELICVSDYKKTNNAIEITCKRTHYLHHLYDERVGLFKEYGCHNLVVGCLLETSDNYYVIGEMARNTSVPNCLQIPGGNVDNTDIKEERVDILNALIRECKEEVNINLQDKNIVESFEIKYISLPNEKSNAYLIIAKGNLRMTKKELIEYYKEYLTYLKDNNLEIEFTRLHFINKKKVKEELDRLKNPKRSYLEDLLEIDSYNKK